MAACANPIAGVNATEKPACKVSWEAYNAKTLAMDSLISVMELKGKMFIPFLSWYNSTLPISDENPDRIFIFKKPGYNQVAIAFVTKGCVTAVATTSIYSMRRFLQINGSVLSPTMEQS